MYEIKFTGYFASSVALDTEFTIRKNWKKKNAPSWHLGNDEKRPLMGF